MKYSLLAIICAFLVSCSSGPEKDFSTINEKQITDYIKANNLEATKCESGLYYTVDEAGEGVKPTSASTVQVAYRGSYLNGEVFDESSERGISFPLKRVIKGWTEGITYFKEGGKGMLLVPSHLGYGPYDTRGIPGGSVLLFDIHLIEVKK
ncbi:peptidylprolyl isomerase [Ancylomarina euxinus]|uniref:Peptidyl-prolyl cis-trans isomerase n=1 Tax=Ancylomarina euxinus TaxID=2283627 RepID=A0A425Y6B1_9BACT|nr:FKBP-type peptidyl-prolyl cis-trans isomerase [Ancylomarina euxinus]MCZ4694096.1 FKBP-type peptidyl-prolyl cis-trans isomerase [Ancylomarina euxinus]MUP15761.1 peptidylprolyl isomerase [Ancylomarina euxinus]RRG24034.1 peptidylprolyl isomerase [Ancylomarina euxinus]